MDREHAPALIGRYHVTRFLGQGGMGRVYAARDPELDREVALKLLRTDRLAPSQVETASEALRREARVTAKLAHPNVVTIYDVGRCTAPEGEQVYVAMELVEGSSLRCWLTQTARPWREVVAMFLQAGLGLAAAHDRGLVHRDFKPGNVLVSRLRAKVTDFGLAHTVAAALQPSLSQADMLTALPERLEMTAAMSQSFGASTMRSLDTDVLSMSETITLRGGAAEALTDHSYGVPTEPSGRTKSATGWRFIGTPAYMAPELLSGAAADERSDQFSFCVSLYEGLYGERPFAGGDVREVADNVLRGRVRPAPRRSRVPKWLRNIVVRGLSVHPEERHPSMRSLLASVAFTARIMWE